MVVLATAEKSGGIQVVVAPVTHSPLGTRGDAIEMPGLVKRDLGLDRERSWIVVAEVNRFLWPGPDVRPLQGGSPFYGAIPDWLFVQVRTEIGRLAACGEVRMIRRTE